MTAPTLRSPDAEGLTRRRRFLVLIICCISMLVVIMDNTIVTVALPTIRDRLGASVSGLQWTVDAYTLVLASFLMFAGSSADRFGRRRVFLIGLASFGVGSLLCSLAPSIGWLIAARALQAVGGTMLNPVALSIVANTFPDRVERARAIGVFGAVSGLALCLGPIVGGALVDGIGWQSIFWINLPIVAVAIVCTLAFVPESRAPRPRRFDPVGQVLVLAVLACLVYVLIESPRLGWASPISLGLVAVVVLGLVGLLVYEPRRTDPLIELRFFRSVPFCAALVTAVAAFYGYGSFLYLNTLYLQNVRDFTALVTGLCMLPMGALIVVGAPLAGRVVGARGPRGPMVLAGVALAAGGLALTWLSPTTPLVALLGIYVLFGVFMSTVNAPITNTAVSGMPMAMSGVAGSTASASRQVGVTLGVAVSGSIVAAAMSHGGVAFTSSSHAAWWTLTGLGVVIVALGLISTTRRALDSARRAASLFDGWH
ncbi:MAG TPA: MFS transporter [Stackebrandtia sp.]|uniref:MFS transporter n=1 Tax=Stackebrandtia sp. TaxID=2023065 RepID=UPI002D3E4F2A|nr:MFS transporter [Stackebrandtia sp.]HZE40848.1 MFS transporter [Stackebrandtia sp.]